MIPAPCEPSGSEKMRRESTHVPFQPQRTPCVKGKAQAEPHKRIERIIEDCELPTVQCDSLVLKDVAASEGLNVLSMCVKSFGYGTSTVVETKVATDTFGVAGRVKMMNCLGRSDIIWQCDPEPSVFKWAEKCEIQTSRTNSHPKFSRTISSQQRSSGKLSETIAGIGAHTVGSNARPHAIHTDH